MPAVAIVLPSQVGDPLDPRFLQPDQRGQRAVDESADGDHVEALFVGQDDLRLVGDRQVRLAGGDLLDRRRRVGGGLDRDVEAGVREVAELLRHVDPGVVGVRVEVERQRERCRSAAAGDVLALLAAGGEAERQGERRDGGRERGGSARVSSPAFYRQVTTRRSASAIRPKRREGDRGEDGDRGEQPRRFELGAVLEDQVPEAGVRRRPTRRRRRRSARRRRRSWRR